MGVDVELYAIGEVTDEEMAQAAEYLNDRVGHMRWDGDDDPIVERSKYYPGRIQFNTLERYYGPGYERGRWPEIYAAILAMRAAFPGCSIHYGGDTTEDHPAVTDEALAAIWDHWLGPDGQAYGRFWRNWQAERGTPS